jgi:hypothetical protein
MRIEGPDTYEMSLNKTAMTVRCVKGTPRFSGLATNDMPKLYIVSIAGKPVYVGYTKRSVRSRIHEGLKAAGKNGYHGYAWRNAKKATLKVWCHMNAIKRNERDIETVEAEVVFLIRQTGDWPEFQTEIHFHRSTEIHRRLAAGIMKHYEVLQARRCRSRLSGQRGASACL